MKVMVTGVNGMDGSILAEKYLARGSEVIGISRWDATGINYNIKNALKDKKFKLVTGDITEKGFMEGLIIEHKPNIIFNMASISLVPESFRIPEVTFQTNAIAVLYMLEAIKRFSPETRFYQASTSEQIGANTESPQNTDSKMLPNSPYAVAKLAAFHMVRIYRKMGVYAVNGMLWNHEGERRGADFVTRKISLGVAAIKHKRQEYIELGNLETFRDWGYAEDYCEAMMLMMEQPAPDDYAVATGNSHNIREFVEEAFKVIGMKIKWRGFGRAEEGVDEKGIVRVKVNPEFYRPIDVPYLCGDSSRIQKLGWKPKIKFEELVKRMVKHDLKTR